MSTVRLTTGQALVRWQYRRELVARGIFEMPESLGRSHIGASHSDDDVDRSLEAAGASLRARGRRARAPGAMSVTLAGAPVSWGVDFAGDPANPPPGEVLDGIAAAGLEWMELGPPGYLPASASVLADRGLRSVGRSGSRTCTTPPPMTA